MTRRVLLISFVASSASAHAQPASAQAEVLFREGRELMAAGRLAQACSAFEQSQRLEPVVTTLLNLAGCRERNGQLATAWGLFLDAERQTRAASDSATQQLHDVALDRATKLEPRISKLTILVPQSSRIAGLEVLRDQERIDPGMWDGALPVDGGGYTITARAPGARTWSFKVSVAVEGDHKTVEVPDLRRELGPSTTTTRAAPTTHALTSVEPGDDDVVEPSRSSSKLVPVAVGGVAVALVGVALGLSLWGDSTYDAAKSELGDQSRRDALFDSANTKRYAAESLALAGVGCAGVAIWLYLRPRDATSSAVASRRHVLVSPMGIAIVGGF